MYTMSMYKTWYVYIKECFIAGHVALLIKYVPGMHEAMHKLGKFIIPLLRRQKQEDQEFKVILSCVVSSGPAWAA